MGNSNKRELVEQETNNLDTLIDDIERLKKLYVVKDTFLEFLEATVEEYLKPMKRFKTIYKLKKNIKCQNDLFYTIRVIQNTRSGKLFNLKIIKMSEILEIGLEKFKILFANEMKALIYFKHPHVENLINVYYDKLLEDFVLYVVTDHTTKYSLVDVINEHIENKKRFNDEEISTILKILIETVYKFKSDNLIHRNLSLENILFVKEGDFNTLCIKNFYFSVFSESTNKVRGITGPLWFMAPEMLQDTIYDNKVDIWSLGLILYILLTLENPFSGIKTREEMIDLIKSDKCFKKPKYLKKLGINPDALNLCFKMLVENKEFRISPELLIKDKFFSEHLQKINKKPFAEFLDLDWKSIDRLKLKIKNLPKMHNIIFYFFYNLKYYFMDHEEIILLNNFFNYLDNSRDGLVKLQEIEEALLADHQILSKENVKNYLEIFEAILQNDLRNSKTSNINKDSYTYEFFVVANIFLKMYNDREADYVKKKVKFMFLELDESGDKSVSIEELQALFQSVENNNYLEENLSILFMEEFYDDTIIKDFNNLSNNDIENLLFYECGKISSEQEEEFNQKYKSVNSGDLRQTKRDSAIKNKNHNHKINKKSFNSFK